MKIASRFLNPVLILAAMVAGTLFDSPMGTQYSAAFAAERTFFSDLNRTSLSLPAAPRETEVKVQFLATEGGVFFEPHMGGEMGVFRLNGGTESDGRSQVFDLSVRAVFVSRFEFGSGSFDLWNTDFVGGAAASYRFGRDAAEIFYYHKSSHLGTYAESFREEINYSFEVVRLLYMWGAAPELDIYSGFAVVPRADPKELLRKFDLHLGGVWRLHILDPRFYLATDIVAKELHRWHPNFSLEFGYELGKKESAIQTQRVFINYYKGYSNLGQFYREKEQSLSIGIARTN